MASSLLWCCRLLREIRGARSADLRRRRSSTLPALVASSDVLIRSAFILPSNAGGAGVALGNVISMRRADSSWRLLAAAVTAAPGALERLRPEPTPLPLHVQQRSTVSTPAERDEAPAYHYTLRAIVVRRYGRGRTVTGSGRSTSRHITSSTAAERRTSRCAKAVLTSADKSCL